MDDYRVFTFDKARFLIQKVLTLISIKDFQAVYMIDPGVKNEKGCLYMTVAQKSLG